MIDLFLTTDEDTPIRVKIDGPIFDSEQRFLARSGGGSGEYLDRSRGKRQPKAPVGASGDKKFLLGCISCHCFIGTPLTGC